MSTNTFLTTRASSSELITFGNEIETINQLLETNSLGVTWSQLNLLPLSELIALTYKELNALTESDFVKRIKSLVSVYEQHTVDIKTESGLTQHNGSESTLSLGHIVSVYGHGVEAESADEQYNYAYQGDTQTPALSILLNDKDHLTTLKNIFVSMGILYQVTRN